MTYAPLTPEWVRAACVELAKKAGKFNVTHSCVTATWDDGTRKVEVTLTDDGPTRALQSQSFYFDIDALQKTPTEMITYLEQTFPKYFQVDANTTKARLDALYADFVELEKTIIDQLDGIHMSLNKLILEYKTRG
jgi:hypothetical protein